MLAIRFTKFVALAMLLALGLAALVLLTQAGAASIVWQSQPAARDAIKWTDVTIPSDLVVADHAAKHIGQRLDARTIYTAILQGQCIRTAIYCGPSEVEFLVLCEIPSGRLGGLILLADEILTGYEGKLSYWENVINRDRWEVCRD